MTNVVSRSPAGSTPAGSKNRSALKAVLWGGLSAGALDLTWALISGHLQGFDLSSIPQAIASGLLGTRSFRGGIPTVVLGVALEFLITFVATWIFYLSSRKMAFLTQRAVVAGMLYGAVIFFFMRDIVVPLSAAPKFPSTPVAVVAEFIAHLILIGLPMSLAVRRYSS